MNKDDIIRMAREAGFSDITQLELNVEWTCVESEIKHFANLVAAAEREACAKVCDELVTHAQTKGDTDAMFAAIACAFAIRERGAP